MSVAYIFSFTFKTILLSDPSELHPYVQLSVTENISTVQLSQVPGFTGGHQKFIEVCYTAGDIFLIVY